MADTLPKLLQEIHSIRTASDLQSQLVSLRARITALTTDETSTIYAANHTTRELNNKLFNFGLKSELDLTQLDGGLRPILSSSGGGGGGGTPNPTYSITLNAGANTTLTSSKTSAQENESVTITATADSGYTLTSFKVDGSEETSPHEFTMPARNISSSTTAEAISYSINLTAGSNTTLEAKDASGNPITSAQIGDSVTITATASAGYTLTSFKVDGSEETSPHEFTMQAANVSSSTTAEALTLNAPSLTTSAGDYVFDKYNSPTQGVAHDEDDYKDGDTYEDYHYSITIDLTATDASTVSNNGGTITSYEFSYSTDSGTNWTVLQDTSSKTFSHRFGQSSGVKWKSGQAYKVGQIVHHGGVEYKVDNDHTSASGPATDTTNYSPTGFKIENFLGIGAGDGAYAPWYRVIAKNSSGYESDASTIVKYAFIDDTTVYFTLETGPDGNNYWTPVSSTNIGTNYTHFLYMNEALTPRQHDSTLSAQYGDGTIVHSIGSGGGAYNKDRFGNDAPNNGLLRWEDPNAPRTQTYAGGDNANTGNWNWLTVTNYENGLAGGTRGQFQGVFTLVGGTNSSSVTITADNIGNAQVELTGDGSKSLSTLISDHNASGDNDVTLTLGDGDNQTPASGTKITIPKGSGQTLQFVNFDIDDS
jgi:hypothetical protein